MCFNQHKWDMRVETMSVSKLAKGGIAGVILRWSSRLRFPYLFLLTLVLFVLNLFIPDVLPFADEVIMGLVAALLGSLRKKPQGDEIQAPTDSKQ
jgi:hypothetical protein